MAEYLWAQAVALINLTALEYLVADVELIRGNYACGLLIAVSGNFAFMAAEFAAQWAKASAYRIAFETAIDNNDSYPDITTFLREALSGLQATTQHLSEKKIMRPLSQKPGGARAIICAEFRRLDASILSITAHLSALAELLRVPGGLGELTDQ